MAGWSVVIADDRGKLLHAIAGTVPTDDYPDRTARDGEDYAILKLTEYATGSYTLHVDCRGTLDCVRFPKKAQQASNPRA